VRRAALLALVLLAGCAREPLTVLSGSDLPDDVYGSPLPTPTPTLELPARGTVYLVKGGRLAPVERTLQGGVTSVPAAYLQALLLAPRNLPSKIQSAIPGNTRLIAVTIEGNTASVDLSGEFERGGSGRELQLRVAQVVWTVTEDEGISSVRILIEGEAVSVPKPGGVVDAGPVDRADYAPYHPEAS
jgi:hypothetical protein